MNEVTYLVVGASGTVGSLVTQQLLTEGRSVRAASRHPAKPGLQGATPVQLELTDPSSVQLALDGVHRLFLLSPNGGHDDYALLSPILQEAIEREAIERIVLMTAQGVGSLEDLPLRRLEKLLEDSGKDYGIVRPTWFSQDFHTYWGEDLRERDVIRLPAAEAAVAFVDARDIAACAVALITASKPANSGFELTGPAALTFRDAAGVLSTELGRTIRYEPIEEATFRQALAKSGAPEAVIELMVWLFADIRAGSSAGISADVETLLSRPPLRFADYVRNHRAELAPKR